MKKLPVPASQTRKPYHSGYHLIIQLEYLKEVSTSKREKFILDKTLLWSA